MAKYGVGNFKDWHTYGYYQVPDTVCSDQYVSVDKHICHIEDVVSIECEHTSASALESFQSRRVHYWLPLGKTLPWESWFHRNERKPRSPEGRCS